MAYRITNNSKAPRGVHVVGGRLVFIAPGKTRTLDLVNPEIEKRSAALEIEPDGELPDAPADLLAKFDHDGDGKPGGSRKGPRTPAKKPAPRKTTRRAKATK